MYACNNYILYIVFWVWTQQNKTQFESIFNAAEHALGEGLLKLCAQQSTRFEPTATPPSRATRRGQGRKQLLQSGGAHEMRSPAACDSALRSRGVNVCSPHANSSSPNTYGYIRSWRLQRVEFYCPTVS